MKITLQIITMCISLNMFAQKLSFTQDSTYATAPSKSLTIEVLNTVKNVSSNPVNVRWRLLSKNIPSSWEGISVCDIIGCLPVGVEVNDFTLAAGASSDIKCDFFTFKNDGIGYATFVVFDVADSANSAKILKYVGSMGSSSMISSLKEANIKLYNNDNGINIENLIEGKNEISISNALGQNIVSYVTTSEEKVTFAVENKGLYIVSIKNGNKILSDKILIQ